MTFNHVLQAGTSFYFMGDAEEKLMYILDRDIFGITCVQIPLPNKIITMPISEAKQKDIKYYNRASNKWVIAPMLVKIR